MEAADHGGTFLNGQGILKAPWGVIPEMVLGGTR